MNVERDGEEDRHMETRLRERRTAISRWHLLLQDSQWAEVQDEDLAGQKSKGLIWVALALPKLVTSGRSLFIGSMFRW